MKSLFFILAVVLSASFMRAQPSYTVQDSLIFEKLTAKLGAEKDLPIEQLIIKTALYFNGSPYVASTLEKGGGENLIVNLREFDCTTFVENCIAISGTIKSGESSFANYCMILEFIRYREAAIKGYPSRLHYVSDWIYDNSNLSILTDITEELGGIRDTKKINFMTTHPESYRQLKNDKDMIAAMKAVEDDINKRGGYYYLPKQKIPDAESQIEDGDIVVFATSIDGLDYSHIGIAYHTEGRLSFIHASSRAKKVIIEPQSLYDYCMKSPKCTGITVVRINE